MGSWVTSTSYEDHDVVEYGGSTYICTLDVNGITNPEIDTTHWDLFVAKGTDGDGAITKPDVESVLTGEISTHTHPGISPKANASFYLGTGGVSSLAATETTLVINNTAFNGATGVFGLASNQVTVDRTATFSISYEAAISSGASTRTTYAT